MTLNLGDRWSDSFADSPVRAEFGIKGADNGQ